ncbi:hypothetical protein TRAPUB_10649 [Trametes pubescens]|uniref:Phosphatidylglycerol/phosphatidylinositol transfer protein n=1 Tax=Trametes pubescens TaxID=154538 RepID=A0A1M2VYW9_TRAPU|nr:hypothetical protein TRAPUB_10649 [Trametes pubescens]
MKFLLVLSAFASLAAAQMAVIRAPPAQSTFAPGEQFIVDVDRPDTLTGSQEVSVAIGLLSCAGQAPPGTCDGIDTTEEIGTPLYAGPYTPQLRPGGSDLFQNFTVAVPADFPSGAAALSVAHFSLVGARYWPTLEVLTETVFIS